MCTNVILVRILVGKSCARSPKVAGMKKALKHKCFKASCGGDKRDRTADLLNAIQALSQLSYTPKSRRRFPGDVMNDNTLPGESQA